MFRLFNPVYVFFLQFLITNIVLYSEASNYKNSVMIFLYINIPFVLYFLYYSYFKFSKRSNKNKMVYNEQISYNVSFPSYVLSLLILIASIISISITLNYYINTSGGFTNFIKGLKDTLFIYYIQNDSTFYPKKYSDLFTYLTGITSINILMYSKTKKRKLFNSIPLIILLVLLYFYTAMVGSRILFIAPVFAIIIYFITLKKKMKVRYIVLFTVLLVMCLYYILIMQMNRLEETNRSFNLVFDILGNYYYESLKNGFYLIDNNFGFYNPLFWTMKPLLNIPIITKLLGINLLYEFVFGEIPILSRGDDFNYIAQLGINPLYNTLSIFGYSFMYYSFYGILIIFLSFVFIQKLYNNMVYNKSLITTFLFLIAYIACLDELRTFSIFSTFFLYNLIYILIHNFINKISKR